MNTNNINISCDNLIFHGVIYIHISRTFMQRWLYKIAIVTTLQ